jgi:hypothetical protein
MSQTRYYVYSKTSASQKPLKNVATREAGREFKREQNNPTRYGIMDRWTGESVR